MSDKDPIVVPPIGVIRQELACKQAEVRRLRRLLLLAKAVYPPAGDVPAIVQIEATGKEATA